MPVFPDVTEPSGPVVSVRRSGPIELEWVLHSALRQDFLDDHPALGALYGAEPELREAVCDFWGAHGASAAYSELVVLAHHGGLLLADDPMEVIDRLDELCTSLPAAGREYAMEAEKEGDRRLILQRLARLRRSAQVRQRYADLLRRVWGAARPSWERFGRDAVDQAAGTLRATLAKGAGWRDATKGACGFGDVAEKVVANLGADGEIVVIPGYFAHCSLLYDLPGVVLVGIRAESTGAEARARNERLARQLRAISDPTRLAIVDSVRVGPKGVTELSTLFGVAQPTVSNHVKLLRESGLVTDVRKGSKRDLVLEPDAADQLLEDLAHVLGRHKTLAAHDG